MSEKVQMMDAKQTILMDRVCNILIKLNILEKTDVYTVDQDCFLDYMSSHL